MPMSIAAPFVMIILATVLAGCGESHPASSAPQKKQSPRQSSETTTPQQHVPVDDGLDQETRDAIMSKIPKGWVKVTVRIVNSEGQPFTGLRAGFHRKGNFLVFKGGDVNENGELVTAAPIGDDAELIVVRLKGHSREELHRQVVTVPEEGASFTISVK